MKFLSAFVFAFMMLHPVIGQQQDITIFEKKEGNKNIVMARNTGKVAYLVSLNITATGMDVLPDKKVEAVVPAGHMKEMATITPRPGESWSYGYDVSFMEHTGQPVKSTTTPSAPSAEESGASLPVPAIEPAPSTDGSIIVYTQKGCGRCATVKRELTSKGIAYKEVDVNSGAPEVNTMWKELRDTGFSGNSVTMPVVKANGQLYYNIKDLMGFVNGL
jgi:glutaredoxin